jgi:hypothetical protein
MKGQVVDSVWDRSGDTLVLVHRPVVLKEKVLVYAPKPKKKREPLSSDNHFFLNLLFNCYADKQRYYDVAPSAQEYIGKLQASTKDGLFYIGYGAGVGYHTNRWIVMGQAMMYAFQEKRKAIEEEGYYKRNNGYYYVGVRASVGYRFGQNKLVVFPKLELGMNFYDRTEGKNIDSKDYNQLVVADIGIANDVTKFNKRTRTLGPAVQVCYKMNDNYLFYIEPYYNHDIDNTIKSNEPFAMKRNYWGCRLGIMFYFF